MFGLFFTFDLLLVPMKANVLAHHVVHISPYLPTPPPTSSHISPSSPTTSSAWALPQLRVNRLLTYSAHRSASSSTDGSFARRSGRGCSLSSPAKRCGRLEFFSRVPTSARENAFRRTPGSRPSHLRHISPYLATSPHISPYLPRRCSSLGRAAPTSPCCCLAPTWSAFSLIIN